MYIYFDCRSTLNWTNCYFGFVYHICYPNSSIGSYRYFYIDKKITNSDNGNVCSCLCTNVYLFQIMLETPTPWLKSFKLACHPATSIGLYRHLASDRGFFDMIAEAYVKLARSHVKFFGSQEGVVYDPLLRAFVQGSIGALELCHNVGEHHTRHLIKAICSSFKADHPEFKAAGGVLFALLVPR